MRAWATLTALTTSGVALVTYLGTEIGTMISQSGLLGPLGVR
jgi:hypothetical protein